MSNPILQSNQSSAVVATVNESKTKNPWVYNEKDRLTVPHGLQLLPIAPSSGSTSANSTVSFEVSKAGIAMGFWLKLKASASKNLNSFGMLSCIESVTLNTSGRVVERMDRNQMFARYRALPFIRQRAVCQEIKTTVASGTAAVHIWLPFYMFRDPHRYGILTNFEEPFHVDVTFSSLTDALQTGTIALDEAATQLLVHYRQLDEAQTNEVISKNYGDGMLSRLVGISNREPIHFDTPAWNFPETDIATGNEVELHLTQNEAVRSMYVMVTKSGAADVKEQHARITHLKLTFNNTDVFDCDASFFQAYGSNWDMMHAAAGEHGGASDHSLGRVVRIDLGHGDDGDLANVVAFRELSDPTLTVTYDSLHPAPFDNSVDADPNGDGYGEYQVHVIYETATFLTSSAATGRAQLSISS